MFLIDKYSPKHNKELYFHKNVIEKLKIMSKDESIPHIIFYGPEGAGKKTIINMFLEMIYDKYVNDLVDSIYTVKGSGNTTTQVTIKQSNYHIVIEPNNNNFDRYLIQDVVKEYARRMPLNVFTTKKSFKTVLINNIDNLPYYAQTSLRRTLEKYSSTCRFIMWSRSLSKVIDPLRSRCFCFQIKAPTKAQLFKFLLHITSQENIKLNLDDASQENIKLNLDDYTNILDNCDNNIKKTLWSLDLLNCNQSYVTTYDETIDKIAHLLSSNKLQSILLIREYIYNIMITNIDGTKIIKDILNNLLKNDDISFNDKIQITKNASKFEHNLIRGRREIIHLEAFITAVIFILHKN